MGGLTRLRRLAPFAAGVLLAFLLAGCDVATQDQWQSMGPNNDNVVLSLAADPFTPQLLYAGTTGGVYLTRTDARTALQATTGLPSRVFVDAVLPDPHTRGTVYAATSSGLFVSTQYGDNWQPRGTGFPHADTMDALIFGGDATTLLAGSVQHGVYVSHDLGATWQPAGSGLPVGANINALLRNSATGDVFAAVDAHGLYASSDGGQTWAPRSTGIPASADVLALGELAEHSLADTGPTLYVGTSAGLFSSADSGRHWTAVAPDQVQGRVLSLAADPAHLGWLYAGIESPQGFDNVLRSEDAGQHWGAVARGISHPVTAILVLRNPTDGSPLIYAGAQQLTRFPPSVASGPNLVGALSQILLVLVLVGVALWYFRRVQRARSPSTPNGTAAGASGQPGDGQSPVGTPNVVPPATAPHNGHVPLPPSRPPATRGRRQPPGSGSGPGGADD
jgi:hypothetical protein